MDIMNVTPTGMFHIKFKETLDLSWFSQLLGDIKKRGHKWQGIEKERL
jgi:hypothetical protein